MTGWATGGRRGWFGRHRRAPYPPDGGPHPCFHPLDQLAVGGYQPLLGFNLGNDGLLDREGEGNMEVELSCEMFACLTGYDSYDFSRE